MRIEAIGRKVINAINGAVNIMVLTIILLLIAFSGYALWDSNQIHLSADKSNYTAYKPTVTNQGKSFKDLQAINPEVLAWLTVFGTNIDYPVAQGPDDMKYVNTNAEGQYSLSGSIFLDSGDNKDFEGFVNIIYGHHMAKETMFGEIGDFAQKDMFDSHRYGNLYFDGRDHGIEFFAFIHADAYDGAIFTTNVNDTGRQAYLDHLLGKAVYQRDIGVTTDDHIVLLSTCSSSSTNGRDILVGRLRDDLIYKNSFESNATDNNISTLTVDSLPGLWGRTPGWIKWSVICFLLILLLLLLSWMIKNKKRSRRKKTRSRNPSQRKMNNYDKKITSGRKNSNGSNTPDLSDSQLIGHDGVCGGNRGSRPDCEAGRRQNRDSHVA